MEKNKVVEFVKTHKKEIAIAVGLSLVGMAGVAYCKKLDVEYDMALRNAQNALEATKKSVKNALEVTEKACENGIHDVFTQTLANGETCVNALVNDMTPAELGRLGEEMMKLDGVNSNTKTDVIVSYLIKK